MPAQVSQAGFAANFPDGRCASGPSMRVGEGLLDHRVAAVGAVGIHCGQPGVGEEGAVAPGGSVASAEPALWRSVRLRKLDACAGLEPSVRQSTGRHLRGSGSRPR